MEKNATVFVNYYNMFFNSLKMKKKKRKLHNK